MNKTLVLLVFVITVFNVLSNAYYVSKTHEDFNEDEYWTEERRSKAIPMMNIIDSPNSISTKRESFQQQCTSGSPPNAKKPPFGITQYVPETVLSNPPYTKVGKIFFTDPTDNTQYVCSGSIVATNVILTAGHCVAKGDGKTWYEKWTFYPQYKNGPSSYGSYKANTLHTFTEFFAPPQGKKSNLGRDVAFVIVRTNRKGANIGEVLGWLTFMPLSVGIGKQYTALGFPVDACSQQKKWGGLYMVETNGCGNELDHSVSPPTIGLPTTMGGGASGGPWIYMIDIGNDSASVNAVSGLNSYGYNQQCGSIYSPFFDQVVDQFFTDVQSGTAMPGTVNAKEPKEAFIGSSLFWTIVILGTIVFLAFVLMITCIVSGRIVSDRRISRNSNPERQGLLL